MHIKIKTYPPTLISKRKTGIWQVVAEYSTGEVVTKNYNASTYAEACRKYLMEHGRIFGTIYAKPIDI